MQVPVKMETWYFSEMFFSHVLTWNKRRWHRIISHIQSGCQADIVVRELAGRCNICLVDKVYLESEFGPKNCWGSSSSCFGNICSPNFSRRNQFYLSKMELLNLCFGDCLISLWDLYQIRYWVVLPSASLICFLIIRVEQSWTLLHVPAPLFFISR